MVPRNDRRQDGNQGYNGRQPPASLLRVASFVAQNCLHGCDRYHLLVGCGIERSFDVSAKRPDETRDDSRRRRFVDLQTNHRNHRTDFTGPVETTGRSNAWRAGRFSHGKDMKSGETGHSPADFTPQPLGWSSENWSSIGPSGSGSLAWGLVRFGLWRSGLGAHPVAGGAAALGGPS